MLKKTFTVLTLAAALSLGTAPAYAQDYPDEATQTVVADLPDGQVALESDTPDSTPTDVIEESAIARKMTQAEKAQNAAENDKYGGAITIIAMCIVLGALIVLCVLFICFGKISSSLMTRKKMDAHGVSAEEAEEHHEQVDSGETIAAIAMALAEHFGQNHDIEDTILTIRRMKRAYSPWNSKIHGLRVIPTLTHNNH